MFKSRKNSARLLRAACSIAALTMFAGAARADDGSQPETVVVTGVQYALQKSIDDKLSANIVSDGISADEIGAIPEFGLGDALRKIPGVSLQINNGRGEDQFLTIRGLNPDYDTTSVDGMALASTEETTRWVSLDVIPSVIVNGVDVDKTWRVDQPSDAVGGIADLHTRSAFDHPGEFFDAHADAAYWEDHEVVHPELPSGNLDTTYSNTFGPSDEFGLLVTASYWQRSSSTTNTYTLPWSYYPISGVGSGTPTAAIGDNGAKSASTLTPSTNFANTIGIPDLHRWYFYDNDRYRPGVFGRFDFDDHGMFHAHLDGGWFQFINNERRNDQSLQRESDPTMLTDTTGTFSSGAGVLDYDKYVQNRELEYVEAGGGVNFADDMHLDAMFNYSIGHYAQTTAQDTFTTPSSVYSSLGFSYNLAAPTSPLFVPNNLAAFMNPANYDESYTETVLDTSTNELPQAKVEFKKNFDADSTGLGFKAGWTWRQMTQHYDYFQTELTPNSTVTLASIPNGVLNTNVPLYDGEGQTLLLLNRTAIDQYVAANMANYTVQTAADTKADLVNAYRLMETIRAEYAEAQYKQGDLYALLGLRYETTDQAITNYLPASFVPGSPPGTVYAPVDTSSSYSKLLPSLNMNYDLTDTLKLRGAATETLARPEYAQLAENSAASVTGDQASETISNPDLKPRKSANFDLSAEWYWTPGAVASVALFNKQIQNEIETLTTITNDASVPLCTAPCTLTTTTSENAGSAIIQGVELNVADVKFDFLPGFLSDFGGSANTAFMTYDSPNILMSNGSFRKLPQLLYSSKTVENFSLLYSHGPYSGEITYNFTGKMPISFNTSSKVNDQWWAGISTVDAQVKYQVTDYLSFRVQGKNLFDSRPQKVVGLTQQDNYSTLENGRAFYVGVGVTF
ncbi:MAG TPA: TonB-dependent receptor [Rhizomicrobium sp.]|nr:TonB-dependent receptor [Rhizomicrobium sp.]